MNKWYILIGIFFILAGIGVGIYFSSSHKENNNNKSYDATRTTTNSTINEVYENETSNNINNDNESGQHSNNTDNKDDEEKTFTEKEISSFTTTIYTKDSDRQNNITIACSTLNNTTIENGKTFSFSDTVGKATYSKGYEKADVFVDGNLTEALGGGMCQVSTTLYNAVRKVDKLKVTERHEHSDDVPYIADGRDAAVSFGSYDFKFINNTGYTIKIKAKNTKNKVNIKLYELK